MRVFKRRRYFTAVVIENGFASIRHVQAKSFGDAHFGLRSYGPVLFMCHGYKVNLAAKWRLPLVDQVEVPRTLLSELVVAAENDAQLLSESLEERAKDHRESAVDTATSLRSSLSTLRHVRRLFPKMQSWRWGRAGINLGGGR